LSPSGLFNINPGNEVDHSLVRISESPPTPPTPPRLFWPVRLSIRSGICRPWTAIPLHY